MVSVMAESVRAFKSRYVSSISERFRDLQEISYPRLRPLQINQGDYETIPYSGTLLERAEVRVSPGGYSPSRVQDLFSAGSDGFVPQTLVLLGPHGAGKSTVSRKILADWASGSFYADRFDFVLRLSGRALSGMGRSLSLCGLVSAACGLECSEALTRAIFSDASRILLIIDGFEELRWSREEEEEEEYEDPFQDAPRETFLRYLLRREILSELTLLLTSRTFSLRKMKELLQNPSLIQLPGFTPEDKAQYFQHFFPEQAAHALSALNDNPALSALCSAPFTCWLVGSVLKAGMKSELIRESCKTLTRLYLLYIQSLLKSSQPIRAGLRALCALANQGVLTHKSLFEEEELGRRGLSPSEVSLLLPRDPESPPSGFSFLHVSLQDFLAALYYVLGEEPEIQETNGARGEAFLPGICRGRSLCEQAEEHPHLVPSVRFLLGLVNDQRVNEIAGALGCSASYRAKSAVESWLLAGRASSRFSSEALSCFYEAQDEALRSRAFQTEDLMIEQSFYSGAMENIPTRELLYCTSGGRYHSIALEDFLMRPRDLELLSPLLHTAKKLSFTRCGFAEDPVIGGSSPWLARADSQIQELEFHVCVVTPPFFQDLSLLLFSSGSLTKLCLTHLILEDSALKTLCDGLRNPNSTLQELILDDCNLTSSSCRELGSAIRISRSLRTLDMSLNKIEDSGVRFLCEGLKDPGCTLKELRVDFSELTSGCCEDLRSLLMTNRSLNTLSFRDNNFQDSGAKLICEGLLHPGCPLKELRLNECNISSSSCRDFRSVLLSNRTLTTLDLTYNHLEDSGVTVLCEALLDPACILRELILLHCELGPGCCADLASVMAANRSLTKLDLTWNPIQDSGAKVLCEALKSPGCTLQELRLYGCELTSCDTLACAISTNRSLTKLDVSGNQFGDSGIKPLCQALRSPSCPLQEISVGYCSMTAACADEFLAVIDTNRSLSEVDVSFSLDEPPADTDLLCQRFRHPHCTLQKNETQDGTFVYFKYSKKK